MPSKTETSAAPAASDKCAPSGKPWAFGIRTWNPDATSHGGFKWDLTPGARTTAPDWRSVKSCGNGLHANQDGWGDWALLNLSEPKIVGIVRWDPDLAVDLDGKIKAPWMEVVMTSAGASLGSIYGFIQAKWRERLTAVLKAEGAKTASATGSSGHASATGSSGHASATGYKGHASATGDSGHASATGDYGHASATGDYGHASATGSSGHASATGSSAVAASLGGGRAMAVKSGAIVLTRYEWEGGRYVLRDIKSGMVGKKIGKTLIKPDAWYELQAGGLVVEVAHV